jgi:LPXTG-site transpeptidase (sortase) family protein
MSQPPKELLPPSVLEIPRINVEAPIVELGVEADGGLEAPATGDVVGWYRQSARPGQVGNLVGSGHVDWNKQPAVFWRLHELDPGDKLDLIDTGGVRHTYIVEWVRRFDASGAPLDDILGATARRWLTFITCAGHFDPITRDYTERLVVRARLEGDAMSAPRRSTEFQEASTDVP